MLDRTRAGKYSLARGFGEATDLADQAAPAAEQGEWWVFDIKRRDLKQLMKRQDAKPLANYGLWLVLLVASGVLAYATLGSWWAVPAFLLYGTIYGSCDPRSHDLGHGATFKSRWLNTAFADLCLFMTMKEPVDWRWRHTRHHTDTIHVGRDPEILVTRPADLLKVAADFFFLIQLKAEWKGIFSHAFGHITGDARHYLPKSEWRKSIWVSRLFVAVLVGLVAWCVAIGSIVPLLFVWGPRIYANGFYFFGFITQHAALEEDSYDHRLNTRTFVMNPVFEFLYANLNYHIEHHVYPSIPYYNLPVLHAMVRDQLPYTYNGLIDVHREVMPALWRQAHDPDYFVRRELPGTARPPFAGTYGAAPVPAE